MLQQAFSPILTREADFVPNDNRLTGGSLETEKNASPSERDRERMRLGYVEMAGINLSIARENAPEDVIWANKIEYSNKS
ncbi:MAG: hypothetical protein LBK56_03510 [Gracilibacteraceae bacterium]|nr:hypothetical protein [Gracilibacteraceae bacterium]